MKKQEDCSGGRAVLAAPEDAPLNRTEWAVLAGLILVGLFLRLHHLAAASMWYDEGCSIGLAAWTPHFSRLLDTNWTTDPPLTLVLVYVWSSLGRLFLAWGTYASDAWLRLLPCLLGTATIPLMFVMARAFTRQNGAAFIAAFLIAISPFHVFYAQELRPYALMLVLALGAFICMERVFCDGRPRYWVGMTALMTLSMYNHFFSVWMILSMNLCFGVHLTAKVLSRPRVALSALVRETLAWGVSQSVVLLLAFPAFLQAWRISQATSRMTTSWFPPLTLRAGLLTFKDFFAGYSPNAGAYHILAAAAAVGLLLSVWALAKRREALACLSVLFLVPIVGALLLWRGKPFSYYEHRLFLVCSLASFVLVAAGIWGLRRTWLRVAVVAIIGAATLPCLADLYAGRVHAAPQHRLGLRAKADLRGVAEHIRANQQPGDYIAHYSHVSYPSSAYYYLADMPQNYVGFTQQDVDGLIQSFPFPTSWGNLGMLPERLDLVAERAARVWLVESWWEPDELPQSARTVSGWLDYHRVRMERVPYSHVALYRYDLRDAARPLRVANVADLGAIGAVVYVPGAGGAPATGPLLVPAGTDLFDTRAPRDFGLRFPAEARMPTSSPTGAHSVKLIIENTALQPRRLVCRAFECVDAIDPLAFARLDPGKDRWFPVFHSDAALVDEIERQTMASATNAGDPPDEGIAADVNLAPGTYQAVARVWREVRATNDFRATLRFHLDTIAPDQGPVAKQALGDITPFAATGVAGWTWYPLTTFTSVGEPMRLVVTAHNDSNLPKAYADLGRIVFVRAGTLAEGEPFGPVLETTVTVAPQSRHELTFASSLGQEMSRRLDVAVYDREVRTSRNVNLYVERRTQEPQRLHR